MSHDYELYINHTDRFGRFLREAENDRLARSAREPRARHHRVRSLVTTLAGWLVNHRGRLETRTR